RVGAYYHDVGKLAAPQYFIENQARGRNPHDQLDPGTSAALVRSHVLEGIRLAEQANLPEAVKQFIPEHHGTQKIAYFLEQARRRDESVDASEFTYQGPKPQSRETAILMLADSIESAMKVLQDPTAERIRELGKRIVAGKIAEGQLGEAPGGRARGPGARGLDGVGAEGAAGSTGRAHPRARQSDRRRQDCRGSARGGASHDARAESDQAAVRVGAARHVSPPDRLPDAAGAATGAGRCSGSRFPLNGAGQRAGRPRARPAHA